MSETLDPQPSRNFVELARQVVGSAAETRRTLDLMEKQRQIDHERRVTNGLFVLGFSALLLSAIVVAHSSFGASPAVVGSVGVGGALTAATGLLAKQLVSWLRNRAGFRRAADQPSADQPSAEQPDSVAAADKPRAIRHDPRRHLSALRRPTATPKARPNRPGR